MKRMHLELIFLISCGGIILTIMILYIFTGRDYLIESITTIFAILFFASIGIYVSGFFRNQVKGKGK